MRFDKEIPAAMVAIIRWEGHAFARELQLIGEFEMLRLKPLPLWHSQRSGDDRLLLPAGKCGRLPPGW